MIQTPTDPTQQDPTQPKAPKAPQAPNVNYTPNAPTLAPASPAPANNTAAAPPPMTPPSTPNVNPVSTAPTIAPASGQITGPATTPLPGGQNTETAQGPQTAAPTGPLVGGGYEGNGYTWDAGSQGWNVPANQVTAGAANNPVGNAAFQWVTDPISGAFVKKGTEMQIGANGMVTDAQGNPVDMPGSTHSIYIDQSNPGPAPESFQRAGVNGAMGDVRWLGGQAPAPGQFGGPPAVPNAPLGQSGYTSSGGDKPATGLPASGAPTIAAAAPGNTPATSPTSNTGVSLADINPDSDLRSQTILPTNDPSRLDIANRELKNYEDTELPQFRNKLRSTFQGNAALGRLGSGMLRTDVGNLDLAEQNAYNSKKTSLLDAAMGDTIADNRANRDEYRTERGREDALENQSYDRGVEGLTLEDSLTNSALGRALAQYNAGQSNNPANMQLLLSQIFGTQAGQAGQALSGLVKNSAANGVVSGGASGASSGGSSVADAGQSLDPQTLAAILKSLGVGGNAGEDTQDYGVAP